jgi:hypothetical protein
VAEACNRYENASNLRELNTTMAETIEQRNGTAVSGGQSPAMAGPQADAARKLEEEEAMNLARRYRLDYVELASAEVD